MHALIVGLGNPGNQYQGTRHNIGFAFVDSIHAVQLAPNLKLLSASDGNSQPVRFREMKQADVAEFRGSENSLTLMKPTTYMNLSGEAVANYLRFYKISVGNLIVVHDEIDLPPGACRMKQGGGDAGHNGLKSITQQLGGPNYFRVRIGVGRPPVPVATQMDNAVANWVLGRFSAAELKLLAPLFEKVALGLNNLLKGGCSAAALQAAQRALGPDIQVPKPL